MENQVLDIKYIPSTELKDLQVVEGQLIFTTDTKSLYFDDDSVLRNNISSALICFKEEKAIKSLTTILINKLYMGLDTLKIYRNVSNAWQEVKYSDDILDVISDLSEYEIGILKKDNELISPATIAGQVYMDDGTTLISAVDESRLLTVVKTKAVYVQASEEQQKIFEIPFPKENFDFLNGDSMTIIKDSNIISMDRYTLNNGKIIMGDTVPYSNPGDVVLFIFYYRMVYNLNEPVVLGTENYADGSITSPKISPFFRLDADKVTESITRLFLTPQERTKLNGIDYYATNYHHPDTHPASMIEESITRMFVSQVEKNTWNAKADSMNVYTKEQTKQLFTDLIDSSPAALDTLNELAKALNNDPNFSNTMTTELAKKATITQLDAVKGDLDKKVNMTDYIRSAIYNTPTKLVTTEGDMYSITVADANLLEYIDGMTICLKISLGNTGKCMLRINSLAYKPILTQDQYELIEGELKAGSIYTLKYNGTTGSFILQGKGGVKLRDTLENSYIVGTGESIERGDLVDVVDSNKIIKSTPKARILSRNMTQQDKFNSNGRIRIFKLNYKTFLAVWMNNNSLRAQIMYTDGTFMQITATTDIYTELTSDCVTFEGCSITDNKIMIAYASSGHMLSAVLLEIQSNTTIVSLNKYTRQETQAISNINLIPVGTGKCILAWESMEDTRTMYLNVSGTTIVIISSRSNTNYPLGVNCKVSDTQIVFSSTENNKIKTWTMAVADNDFFNSTINALNTDVDTTLVYSNLAMTKVDSNKVMMTWIDNSFTKLYEQIVTVNYDGGITKDSTVVTTKTLNEIKSNTLPNQLVLSNGYFLSASLYDYNAPSLTGGLGNDCIKITVNKVSATTHRYETVDKLTDIYYTSNNISFTMISDNKLIIAFNTKQSGSDIMRLAFIVADARKMPFGVALGKGIDGATVKVQKW